MGKVCSIPGCEKSIRARNWCGIHYDRWRRHGDPLGGRTAVTNRGDAMRYFREVILPYEGNDCLKWPFSSAKGYGKLWSNGRLQTVSRLVCEAVHGKPATPKHEAAHSCGNGHLGCVTKRHLSWKTPDGNAADRLTHGTHSRGERCPTAKLKEADVQKIRALKGHLLQREIASMFNVHFGTISDIHRGTRWAWLKKEECV